FQPRREQFGGSHKARQFTRAEILSSGESYGASVDQPRIELGLASVGRDRNDNGIRNGALVHGR
ncbi:MAG: hypothetical protein AAFY56_23670, partial [Pseudomonadota bacterium]